MAIHRMIKSILTAVIAIVLVFIIVVIYQKPTEDQSEFGLDFETAEYGNQSYVIGWDFNEGQTCASRNLVSLLHWASIINLYVVEPCVHNSFFNMAHCFNSPLSKNSLHFRDYFDLNFWNEQILSHKFGKPLVLWKDFIRDIPDKAIIVYLWRQEGAKTGVLIGADSIQNATSCHEVVTLRPHFTRSIFDEFGIKIVREVCIRFDPFKQVDVWWFTKQILGDYRPPGILILFTYWPGSFQSTIYFNDESLNHKKALEFLKPSHRVIEDSRKYQELFLGDEYIAVMLRIAKIATHLRSKHMPFEKNIPLSSRRLYSPAFISFRKG